MNEPKSQEGMTPLHLAAERGNCKVVRILLACGASVDARDKKDGFTPLHHASSNSCHDVAILLLEQGADPHAVSVRLCPFLSVPHPVLPSALTTRAALWGACRRLRAHRPVPTSPLRSFLPNLGAARVPLLVPEDSSRPQQDVAHEGNPI